MLEQPEKVNGELCGLFAPMEALPQFPETLDRQAVVFANGYVACKHAIAVLRDFVAKRQPLCFRLSKASSGSAGASFFTAVDMRERAEGVRPNCWRSLLSSAP